MIIFKKIWVLAAVLTTQLPAEPVSPYVETQAQTAIQNFFDADSQKNIEITPLTGGYAATGFFVNDAGKKYVLRVIKQSETTLKVSAELHAMRKGASAEIAPAIRWVSDDGHAILMDFIEGGTLKLEQGKKPEVIVKVADTMRTVHAFPKNPFGAPSFEEHMEKFYKEHSQNSGNPEIWESAITIIREGAALLKSLEAPLATIHGDLNPRNILISNQKVYFIDWSDGMYTEPFLDLGDYLATMDYSPEEEALLLKSYLQHEPTPLEKTRFLIAKKMTLARMAMETENVANKLKSKNQKKINTPRKEISYYVKAFANNEEQLTAQFFWEVSERFLEAANAIEICK